MGVAHASGDSGSIVGGTTVLPGEWPDTVAVLGKNGSCSGTLIAPDVVLTAGHCADIEPVAIIANTIDYAHAGGTRVAVESTVAYPSWQTTYDVSIIVLANEVTGVEPRAAGTGCTFEGFKANTNVRLVGFGATDMQGTVSNTQLKEAMTTVTDPVCSGGNGCNSMVAPGGEFVAGGSGTADSCFGDSGGPVYLETAGGPVVIGAVSRGVDNAQTPCGGGGIYVRTDKIIQWIEETAGRTIAKDDCDGDPAVDTYRADEPDTDPDEIGGCSTSGGAGSGAAVFALAFAARRRIARPQGTRSR